MNPTIAVCIPCIESHVYLIDRCIESINRQILHPKEIVISISSVSNGDKINDIIKNVTEKYPRLNIKALLTSENKFAGENRNIAIAECKSDIITFIDVDDTMYNNRLFVIMKIFMVNPNYIGILHHFAENDEERIEKWTYDSDCLIPYKYTDKMHFGHPSFRREVFKEFKYNSESRMQDIQFVAALLPKHQADLCIYEKKLTKYISRDSTLYSKKDFKF